jgi:GNAT superfamily N-acetyltransferase
LAPFKGEHRWQWQFAENPFGPEAPEHIPVWVAVDDGKVVGQIAVQATQVMIEGAICSAGWIVDVMILPAYRGRGLGNQLYDAVARDVPILLMVTMAPATRRMAERDGAIELGDAWQFSRWVRLRPDDVLRYLLQRLENRSRLLAVARIGCDVFQFHRMFAPLANAALAVRNVARRQPRIGLEIAEVERFGPEIDALWQSVAHHYAALSVRDSRYLNWRFVDCPDLSYRRFVARKGDLVVGYSVLRRTEPVELRLGVIVELFAAPDDTATLGSLLDHAMHHFGSDVASIECVTSHPETAGMLRARGFHRTRTTMATGSFADPVLRDHARSLRGKWLFTKSDHDWDQIHVV